MTIEMAHVKILMAVLLGLLVLMIGRTITKRDRNSHSKIDLDDLLVDPQTDRISKAAVVLMASFALSSWVIIYLTLSGKLTDVLFAAYLTAYAAPAVVKIISDAKSPP